jgi:hypothetical protein
MKTPLLGGAFDASEMTLLPHLCGSSLIDQSCHAPLVRTNSGDSAGRTAVEDRRKIWRPAEAVVASRRQRNDGGGLDQPAFNRHRLNAEKLIIFNKLEQLSASNWTRVALARESATRCSIALAVAEPFAAALLPLVARIGNAERAFTGDDRALPIAGAAAISVPVPLRPCICGKSGESQGNQGGAEGEGSLFHVVSPFGTNALMCCGQPAAGSARMEKIFI